MFHSEDHSFVVCAYGESPYLEECITSVLSQTVHTQVLMSTATDNAYIRGLAEKYQLPLAVKQGGPGIASDWNFALTSATTPLVTIAHQDDTYSPHYAEELLACPSSLDDLLIYFTNYGELRSGKPVDDNKLLRTKRKLLAPLKDGKNRSSIWWRRRILSLGSAICCPSVTINTTKVATPLFHDALKSNLDWEAWERLTRLDGSFYYNSEILMHHRIHQASTTSHIIAEGSRTNEDLVMFEKFWHRPMARLITRVYASSERSNTDLEA